MYDVHPYMHSRIFYSGEEGQSFAGMLEPLFGQVDDKVCFVGRMCFSASVRVVGVCVCICVNALARVSVETYAHVRIRTKMNPCTAPHEQT
jgi:hypothetical protein